MSERPDDTMNRNIPAVRPLKHCARRNAGSSTAGSRGLDQGELLRDQRGFLAQLIAPVRDQGALEAHLRHGDADRSDCAAPRAIVQRNAYAAQVRYELLRVYCNSVPANLGD